MMFNWRTFNSSTFVGERWPDSYTYQTLATVVYQDTRLVQSTRELISLIEYITQTSRKPILPDELSLQTSRSTVILASYVSQTLRDYYGFVQELFQTQRFAQDGRFPILQLVRSITKSHTSTSQSVRTTYQYRYVQAQAIRRVGLYNQLNLQVVRDIWALQPIYTELLDIKYIGFIRLLQDGFESQLDTIALFPQESKLYKLSLVNSTGSDIMNIRLGFENDPYDSEHNLARRMFGISNQAISQDTARIEVGTSFDTLFKIVGEQYVTVKQDTLNNGSSVDIYIKVNQPADILPITGIPLYIDFEVV